MIPMMVLYKKDGKYILYFIIKNKTIEIFVEYKHLRYLDVYMYVTQAEVHILLTP